MQTNTKQGRTQTPIPHIVIVGGGAGGLELATKLGRKLGKKRKANITLIDKHRVHVWKPLLHEVATGSLDAEIDGVVYRAHAKRHHYRFQLGAMTELDPEKKRIILAPIVDEDDRQIMPERHLSYDTLVLALGSVSNDFGTPGVQEYCYLLDSKAQAQRFQQKLLNLLMQKSSAATSAPIKLAIVGAGATGVELSAELNHVIDVVNVYDGDGTTNLSLSVDLIEAGERILPALPERIAESAASELEKLGVRVRTQTRITEANDQGFIDADGELIKADLMVWAAGVKAQAWLAKVGLATNQLNQVRCGLTLKSESNESIYVIGDCCHVEMPDGVKVPPRAQAAHQMASVVASNVQREMIGKPLLNFMYKDYGSLVNLARFSTVGSLMGNLMRGTMFVEGRVARFVYLSLYRMHQLAIHGYIKGPFVILLSRISKIIRPKIKLH